MPPKKTKTKTPILNSINMLKQYITIPVIFAYIVSIVLIYNTYGYLTELENCDCFDRSKVDIKFLKYYEFAIGILGTCVLLLNVFIYLYPSNKKVGGGPLMESLKTNGGLRISNISKELMSFWINCEIDNFCLLKWDLNRAIWIWSLLYSMFATETNW